MSNHEKRIEALEKIVFQQSAAIRELIKRSMPSSNGYVNDCAERFRPHSGGRVSNRISVERTRPWGSGNT